MRSVLAFLLLCVTTALADDFVDVVVTSRDFGLGLVSNTVCALRPMAPLRRTYGDSIIMLEPKEQMTDENGQTTFTHVLWGKYTLQLGLGKWTLTLGTNHIGSVSAAALVTEGTLPPNPTTSYYTMGQVDALLANIGSAAGAVTNGQTNVLFKAADTNGLTLQGPTGGTGYSFLWRNDHLRLTNSVFADDWLDFNHGLAIGTGPTTTWSVDSTDGSSTFGGDVTAPGFFGSFYGTADSALKAASVQDAINGTDAITFGGTSLKIMQVKNSAGQVKIAINRDTGEIAGTLIDGTTSTLSNINSNSFDADTKAQLALAGTGGGALTAGLTNAWRTDAQAASANPSNSVPFSHSLIHKRRAPYMGFNSYYYGGGSIPYSQYSTNYIWEAAQVMLTNGYVAAGYDTMIFDAGWATNRDANYNIQAVPTYVPEGMSNFIRELRAYGIPRVALYTEPNDRLSATGTPTGAGATNWFRDAVTFGNWGVDHIKYDAGSTNTLGIAQSFIGKLQSINPDAYVTWGPFSTECITNFPWMLDWLSAYESVRDGQQGADWFGDMSVKDLLCIRMLDNAIWFNQRWSGSGTFAAAGFIPLDNGNAGRNRLVLSGAAVARAPLQLGGLIAPAGTVFYSSIASTLLPIILNREMIDIHQNAQGSPFVAQAVHGDVSNWDNHGVADPSGYSVYAVAMDSPSLAAAHCIALGIMNRDTNTLSSPQSISIAFTNLGIKTGTPCAVRDVWNNTNGFQTNTWVYSLPPADGALLKVYPLMNEPDLTAKTAVTNTVSLNLLNGMIYNQSSVWTANLSAYLRQYDVNEINFPTTYIGQALMIDTATGTANHGFFDWFVPRTELIGTNVDFIVHVVTTATGTNSYGMAMGGWADGGSGGYFQHANCAVGAGNGTWGTNYLGSATTAVKEYWITNSFTIPSRNMSLFARWGNGATNAAIKMYVMEAMVKVRP